MTSIRVGVMIPPSSVHTHDRWEQWRATFPDAGVNLTYVTGARAPFPHTRVDGREGLPHVGKVTEKSAAWWIAEGDDDWRCKADDDTLVHLPRLRATLNALDASVPVYMGYLKWRGWEIGGFRACGGVWGDAQNVWDAFRTTPRCKHASGPFPYMAGAFYCMSKPARLLLAQDAEFGTFLRDARRRNERGQACTRSAACAAQPVASRMWHHEDAGIGMNLFRAVARASATLMVVTTPGHYNDPFAIEQSASHRDIIWSRRAIWVHGIKRHSLYVHARERWNTSRPFALDAAVACVPPSLDRGRWDAARLPCAGDPTRFCSIDVARHFRVCRFPWPA